MKKVLTGNFAAAYAAVAARVQVISAYPITPQTTIVEILSELVARGELAADFIKVESEHSALAACIGAQAAGARTFTATSAQGLALMHELIHWTGRARLPIVLANVNRAMAPGWSIWADATDAVSERDTGWMQIYCEDNQEVFDSILMAYRIGEREGVLLPTLVNLDAFFLSHTSQVVDLYDAERIDAFLPPYRPAVKLDVADPRSFGALTSPDYYYEFSFKIQKAHEAAAQAITETGKEFGTLFGRSYGLTEAYRCEDAEVVLVTYGTIAGTAKVAADRLRNRGVRAGVLKIRYFRPFPAEDVVRILGRVKAAGVVDRAVSYGQAGPFYTETRSVLPGAGPALTGFIAGLGGRDVSVADLESMFLQLREGKPSPLVWIGVKP
ncbi:MAG: transketolase C-terminal domain-containing protein [bacterium]|nr:transketolase C-terminal domain-containing protein [bacterium]